MEEGQALVSAGTAKVNQLLELAAQYGAAFVEAIRPFRREAVDRP